MTFWGLGLVLVINGFLVGASYAQQSSSSSLEREGHVHLASLPVLSPHTGDGSNPPCNASMRPQYHPPFIRWTEDWSFLRCKQLRSDRWDRLKYVPLGHNESRYLSIGAEARGIYEAYQNQYWGDGPQDNNGWLLQNYLLHADVHFDSRVRLFGELQSTLANGRTGGPRPYDEDKLDLHQAFVDYGLPTRYRSTLRIGRQELQYDSGRLVDARFGLNTRLSYDGFKTITQVGKTNVEAFAVRPTLQRTGIFDDTPNSKEIFWGLYATRPLTPSLMLDLYYLGFDTKAWTFSSGTGHFQPHTLGTRFSGRLGAFDFNNEANIQVGTFGEREVRAWSVSLLHGYTFENTKASPRVSLRADVTSGDRGLQGHALGSFFPLFASGKYFEEADLNGPVNTIDVIPSVDLHASRTWTVTPIYGVFWRESIRDGLYGYAGNLYKTGDRSSARLIGQNFEIDVTHVIAPHTILRGVYQHFAAGSFLMETPPGKDVNYGTVWVVYHF